MARNSDKYPKVVELDSSGHYPPRFVQVTNEEHADLRKNWLDYHGGMGCIDKLSYLYDAERQLKKSEVDVPVSELDVWCAYE